MPVEIVLVRHGQSEGNRDRVFTGHGPSCLTELGHRQAEATARTLAVRPIDGFYTSDLVRCVETAAPLERLAGVRPIETAALRERDVGEFTGLDFATVQERFPDGWLAMVARDASYRPPGGESHADCGHRVGRFLDELIERHRSGRVVAFTHGVAIDHLLRHVVGLDATGVRRAFFHVDNCSIQRLAYHPEHGSFRILAVNDTSHLGDLAG